MSVIVHKYGRLFDDFEIGATYEHPWEVTVDGGAIALFQASFLDASPVYASARFARDLGFRDRPLHPLLVLNYGLSFSVHDVSEQAIAHLAYIDVRFPDAAYPGDTLTASSSVLGVKRASTGDRGVVHVRTTVRNQESRVVCTFERKALVRAEPRAPSIAPGAARERYTHRPPRFAEEHPTTTHVLPMELRANVGTRTRAGFPIFADDFAPGQVFAHDIGRTVSEAEHMQLTCLLRNTHPLHFDEIYCKSGASFAGTRVVYGGLVLAWVAALASRDTCGNLIWDVGLDGGAHPAGVVAGDTLFAASKVLDVAPHTSGACKRVRFRLVGVKNVRPSDLLEREHDLFANELGKADDQRIKEKVFEIDRSVLLRCRD